MADGTQFTPQEFASKIKAKYPAYASIPDDQLVEKITAKYPQYKEQIKQASPESQRPDAVKQAQVSVAKPLTQAQPTERAMQQGIGGPPMFVDVPSGEGKKFEEAGKKGYAQGGKTGMEMVGSTIGAEGGAGVKGIAGFLMRMLGSGAGAGVGNIAGQAAGTGKVDVKEAVKTGATYSALEGGGELVGAAGSKILSKADPLARINKILGVGAEDIRVGKAPEAMDEFVTNPARGVQKAGIDEKALAKMNPIERNSAIVKAKDAAGKQLEASFSAATQQGKTVSLRQTVDDIFKQIPDKNLQAQTRQRLSQIVNKALGKPNVFEEVPYMKMIADLDKLTPNQAWAIRRGLDDFANFASEGTVKTFKDVATELRRAISKETRKIVPESAPFDQQYSDLAAASKATQRSVNKFARDAPKSLLRKWAKRAAIAGGAGAAGGLGYEAGKHFTLP